MIKEKWDQAQSLEYKFHETDNLRKDDERWAGASRNLLLALGLDVEMTGKTILDLGCGSRLRTACLKEHNRVVGIDPLIDRYSDLEFSDVKSVEHYSVPAEEMVESLRGQVDHLVCLNVLDHCIEEEKVLDNVRAYLKPGGVFYLWTDIGHNDDMHESTMDADDIRFYLQKIGFAMDRYTVGVDVMKFSVRDVPDFKRCGQTCAPGRKCAVYRAVRKID